MKMSFKYILSAFQKDQFWLPVAFWGLFALLVSVFFEGDNAVNGARSFIGFTLPLLSGGMAAYAVLQDSALELQFATARPAWRMLAERLGLVLVVITIVSGSFQLLLYTLNIHLLYGNFWQTQLVWLVPNFSIIALACLASLITANSNTGFAFTGGLWILQLLLRGWFAYNEPARYILLFFGTMAPGHETLPANQITLTAIGILCLVGSWILLKQQERYI